MNSIKKISFVVPVYNEEDNINLLFDEVSAVMRTLKYPYELLFIDDCSKDKSLKTIKELARRRSQVKYVSFEKNRGQSAALSAGFEAAKGDVIITMDADLQNDPRDIPAMLSLYKKYDMVAGWRHKRQDTFGKRISSKIGNGIRKLFTKDYIHDTGCSLKVMKASMLKRVKIFKGLHRFLSTLMRLEGATVVEMKVNHRARQFGVSKYTNLRRGIEGLADLIAVRWMIKRNVPYKIKEGSNGR